MPALVESEAVLECVFADGADLEALPPQAKLLRLPLGKLFDVGRACQYGFFEHLLKAGPSWATYISRRHCRLLLSVLDGDWQADPGCEAEGQALSLAIENLSYNSLLVNGQRLARGKSTTVSEGATLSFVGGEEGAEVFLKFVFRPFLPDGQLMCRSSSLPRSPAQLELRRFSPVQVSRSCSRASPVSLPCELHTEELAEAFPAPLASGDISRPSAMDVAVAVLERVYIVGNDLAGLPPQAKALGLPLGVSVEIGRLCQPGFFEKLLQAEPQWITQLSRKQCRLQLSVEDGGAICLSVQNLGTNAVFVDGEKLANAGGKKLLEGGTLGFAAAVSGTRETRFLKLIEFMLKRGPSSDVADMWT